MRRKSIRRIPPPWSIEERSESLIPVCLSAYGAKKIFEELFAG
jgi:hypothetical protein